METRLSIHLSLLCLKMKQIETLNAMKMFFVVTLIIASVLSGIVCDIFDISIAQILKCFHNYILGV